MPVHAWKVPLFVVLLVPFAMILSDALLGTLGADPVARLEQRTGDWALRVLLATLAVTPMRRISGWTWPLRCRRMLGLFAFFYATVHVAVYFAVDLGAFWTSFFAAMLDKPWISAGAIAWLLMMPLALTAPKGMQARLGRRWQTLHRLVYAVGLLAVLHFIWQVKHGNEIAVREPLVYGAIFSVLMAFRIPILAAFFRRNQKPRNRLNASTKPISAAAPISHQMPPLEDTSRRVVSSIPAVGVPDSIFPPDSRGSMPGASTRNRCVPKAS